MPMPIILGGGLTRNIPAIENNNGRYLMVAKQIDSVHKVFYVPQFLIVVWIQTKLHATWISCPPKTKTKTNPNNYFVNFFPTQ